MSDHPHHEALFRPADIGTLPVPNRIIMAPLTRSRASQPGDVQSEMNARYYAQRAGAGLIISEATQVSPHGKGYAWTPGIFSDAQVEGWKKVTEAVREAGGRMYAQLWHVGRISHPSLLPDNDLPLAPSAIKPEGEAFVGDAHPDGPTLPFVEPRAMERDDILRTVDAFAKAAECAHSAGFDGVEVHAANGYLLDQFIRSSTNHRDDEYGGSVENRTRLLHEVIDGVKSYWPTGRIGVRLSPYGSMNDIEDATPEETFGHVAQSLNALSLGYVHLMRDTEAPEDGRIDGADETITERGEKMRALIRERWRGTLLV
ncbi:MAG: alkene reductase, partial [Pseudomonadota bacterium]